MLIYIKIIRNISLRNNFLCNSTPFQLNSSSHSVLSCPLWLWYLIPFPPSSLSPRLHSLRAELRLPPTASLRWRISEQSPRWRRSVLLLPDWIPAARTQSADLPQCQHPLLEWQGTTLSWWAFWLLFSKNCIIIIWQIFWNYYYIIVVIIVLIIHIIRTEVVYTENNMN